MAGEHEEEEDENRHRQRKLEEALEAKSLRRIISAYLNYPEAAEEDVKRYERSFRKLKPDHKALLPHYPLRFQRLRRCISSNSHFIFDMLQGFEPPIDMSQDIHCCEDSCCQDTPSGQILAAESKDYSFQSASTSGRVHSNHDQADIQGNLMSNSMKGVIHHEASGTLVNQEAQEEGPHDCITESSAAGLVKSEETSTSGVNNGGDTNGSEYSSPHDWLDPSLQLNVPLADVDKVRCIIRNIVRDWAAEGRNEREQCYRPILEELDSLFPNRHEKSLPACLIPGAGLGRLALEISCLGFMSQGNEFSYYMMICSSFILNYAQTAGQWTIYPWIHSNCNSRSDSDQLRPVLIPDIHPASAGISDGFSMCGGDFVEVYNDPSQVGVWDAVVTCFFIDTAHNVVEYIEIIAKILKEGGVWINLGPLLYHFADAYGHEDEMSIELSLDDVKRVALHYGFEIEKEKTIETTYTTNPLSMMQNRYYAAFWTMRKKSGISTLHESLLQ